MNAVLLVKSFDKKVIKWAFCFWCIDKKERYFWQICLMQLRKQSDLSLRVGRLLHKSFSRDQLLYNPVDSAHVGSFATETVCALSIERIPALWLCSVKSVIIKREDRDLPLHSLQVTLFSTLRDKAHYYASDIGPQCL